MIQELLGVSDMYDAPAKIMDILLRDEQRRDDIFRQFIKHFNGDLSWDYFGELYESELSEHKNKKQFFSPDCLYDLCTELVTHNGIVHEPAAGSGGMVIKYWWKQASKQLPWDFVPSSLIFSCWELSDRSLPLLLFNLAIRGINAEVFYGDVLERNVKARYVVINEENDPMAFSRIIRTI